MRRGIITFRSIAATATPLGTDDRARNDGACTSNYRGLSIARTPSTRIVPAQHRPHLLDGVEQERASGPQPGLRLADPRLDHRPLAQQVGRHPRDLALRRLDELVDGGARPAQAHAAEAAARQIEAVHAIHRSGDARPPIERRERVLLRYEQVLDLDVVAARAPHAADVPGVDDLDLRLRMEVGDPHVLVAVGPQAGPVTVEDLAGAVEQERMHAPAGEEPVAGDAIAA